MIGCLLAIRLVPRPPRYGAAARHPHLGRRGAPLRGQLAAGRGDVLHRSPRRHVLVQLRRAPAPRREADARPGCAHLRADRIGVRLRRTLRSADSRDRGQGTAGARARRRGRVRRAAAHPCPPGRRCSRSASCSSSRASATCSGARAPSRRCSSPHRTTCAGAPRASTSSPSWAGRPSAASSRAR